MRSRPAARLFRTLSCLAGLAAALAVPMTGAARADEEVNVYSYRQEVLIRPLLDRFTAETGIAVNVVYDRNIMTRLQAEGANSPADAVLTTDAGRLIRLDHADLLQAVSSAVLEEAVPSQYRDPDGHWFGLSVRARPLVHSRDRVDPATLSTYAALGDPEWRGRICIRSSSNIYNQSLLSAMIAHDGVEAVEAWAGDFVANFARVPQGGDRDQIRAVAAGECDVAVVNMYYLAGMLASDDAAEREAAEKVAIFWPDQQGHGTHVNISGAGVTAHAPNRDNAVRLIEFLAGEEAQRIYAEVVNEYPVREGTPAAAPIAAFGPFRADDLLLERLAEHNAEAVRLADRVGWR